VKHLLLHEQELQITVPHKYKPYKRIRCQRKQLLWKTNI